MSDLKKSYMTASGLLPEKLWRDAFTLSENEMMKAEEFRLRLNKPFAIVLSNNVILKSQVTMSDIEETVARSTASSFHTFWNQISNGFITAPGGHRVGFCGTVCDGGIRDITSVNIRIAKSVFGISEKITEEIAKGPPGNILVISPPGGGKTTFIREMARKFSKSKNVSVADERSELFPIFSGEQVFDPYNCDVMTGMKKDKAAMALLRSMSPDYIVMDEIGGPDDVAAIEAVVSSGVEIIAGLHAGNVFEAEQKEWFKPIMPFFTYFITIEKKAGERFYSLYKAEEADESTGSNIDFCILSQRGDKSVDDTEKAAGGARQLSGGF